MEGSGSGSESVQRVTDLDPGGPENHTDPDQAQILSTVVDLFFLLVKLVKFFAYRTVSTIYSTVVSFN
jgi:hypothetical protein